MTRIRLSDFFPLSLFFYLYFRLLKFSVFEVGLSTLQRKSGTFSLENWFLFSEKNILKKNSPEKLFPVTEIFTFCCRSCKFTKKLRYVFFGKMIFILRKKYLGKHSPENLIPVFENFKLIQSVLTFHKENC